ncbi:hypothetical protein CK203_050354 [Vitis vinifera]|uniref:Aspartic peptidase DDI1-type domain-containing protein n=1 Tax=Vitis vinifera TaxID=29760 RepID=A0A438GZY4_VITVI|nr:hypothetical protein CK203_050354 [Vitis vinifera]
MMDGMQNDLSHKIDNLQYSISRLTNLNIVQKKGRFPSQPHQNPKGIHEMEAHVGKSSRVRDVKAMITLRSGKKIELPTPKPHDEIENEKEIEKKEKIKGNKKGSSGRKEDHDSIVKENPNKIVINGDVMKKHMPPPFPQALHGKKRISNALEILEVLRQVKLNVNKKAFLTKQVSAIIQCKSPVKYKDPGCPTISMIIEGTLVEKALLDLGASLNLLPYSVYKQLGLGELKPTSITLSLVDRSMKIPRGMIEDVLVQVNNFYYPVDFVVLDMDPIVKETNYVPIILGRPFLATSNAIINCRNGLMQLTFGNMTLELNIFYMVQEANQSGRKRRSKRGLPEPSDLLTTLPPWRMIEEILPLFKENKVQEAVKEEAPKLKCKEYIRTGCPDTPSKGIRKTYPDKMLSFHPDTFHPDGSHPDSGSAPAIPSGCRHFTPRCDILLRRHYIRNSNAEWERRHFKFPGWTYPDSLIAPYPDGRAIILPQVFRCSPKAS